MIELLLVAERLVAEGELDRAAHLFEQVTEADPRNAIAVVGLARVAQARGNEAGAITLARRALEIDPEDVAAQRLVVEISGATIDAAGDAEAASASATRRRSIVDRILALFGIRA